jgi:mono/diheme cytochrome c family protein
MALSSASKWKMAGFRQQIFCVLAGKRACVGALVSAVFWCLPAVAATGETVSYNNQIGPILSEHCFRCHGPDSASRKPKKEPLRLDRGEFAYKVRDSGKPVIIKGDPDASELVRRITATDDDVMPPASEQKLLKPAEIALVKEWISQGGKYEKHWSLIPPVKPAVPADGAGWARNPVDSFVARKLAQNGLAPNPEEEKTRLYRRLSFDLTGLPPSPRDVERFVHSDSPKAYEKAVDRMLASDAGAEHFTRLWLDAVRYADTQGIHLDFARTIWPYRDWVIAAYKTNMAFDQFTIEQIAGDMLSGSSQAQKIASGYNRLLETTSEGGAIPDEYAAIYARDRVDTTTAVWLGLTVGCATCHDHKFDPITTKDFYSLTAFFRNNTMSILDGPTGNDAPMLFLPARKDVKPWKKSEPELAATKQAVSDRKHEQAPAFTNWLAQLRSNPIVRPVGFDPALRLPMTEPEGPCEGYAGLTTIAWAAGDERKAGPFGSAPLLADGEVVENAAPVVTRHGEASYGAFIYVEDSPNGAVISRMNTAEKFRGWDLFLSDGRPTVHIVDEYPDKALKVTAKERLEGGRWHHVMAVFDGMKTGADAVALYVDGVEAKVEVNNNTLGSNILADVPMRLGARTGTNGPADALSGGRVFLQDLRFYDTALSAKEVARLALSGLTRSAAEAKDDDLRKVYFAEYDQPSEHLAAKLKKVEAKADAIRKRGTTTLVMQEKSDTKPIAHILVRGNYLTEGAEVSAETPAALPPMTSDDPRNRLGLARWIMSRNDPLVARVTVNRLWSQIFGTGIVETTEDFGVMGARPTDQDLMDWLAVEFMDSGWNFRHMIKTMVMSATYRQSEAISPEKLEKDPQDKLLSRAPHIRLDAEEIRDQALAASGLLTNKLGGPPVKSYQPEGVWESVAMKESDTRFYKQDSGAAVYRRSLYMYWKRTAPPPNMEILNAPTRETFCTRRDRTDTPLQALVTLNDTQFVEASRNLAARAIHSSRKFDRRLDTVTELLLARKMVPEERNVIRKMEEHFLTTFKSDPEAAKKLIAVGDSKSDPAIPPAQLAAWTLISSEILNLDQSLTK